MKTKMPEKPNDEKQAEDKLFMELFESELAHLYKIADEAMTVLNAISAVNPEAMKLQGLFDAVNRWYTNPRQKILIDRFKKERGSNEKHIH